jgi:hypothetical protein
MSILAQVTFSCMNNSSGTSCDIVGLDLQGAIDKTQRFEGCRFVEGDFNEPLQFGDVSYKFGLDLDL